MNIQGLQKLTLLDYPQKVACTIFTGGCNFRCPFCHNAGLALSREQNEPLDTDEVLAFLKKRAGVLDGVCISGGEPLLQPDLKDFIIKVRSLGYSVKLDTNGSLFRQLKELTEEGLLDFVAMDVKNCRERYAEAAGLSGFEIGNVEESVQFLLQGKLPYEFRTTVAEPLHTVEDIARLSKWIEGAERYFIQPFVDSADVLKAGLKPCSKETMLQMLEAARENVPSACLRGVE